MFEYYGNIHVYCPRVGADEPLGSIFFSESLLFSPTAHFRKIVPLNDNFTIFPIQMHRRPMLTVP